MNPVVGYLLGAFVPLALRTVLFVLVFRFRKHRVSFLTSFLLAASPVFLSLIPFSIPEIVSMIAGIGIALFILSQYTDVDILPEGTLVVLGVEIVGRVLMAALRLAVI